MRYFEQCKNQLFNKDIFTKNYVESMLVKCNQIFHYENLPVEKRLLENYLMKNGHCIFTKIENDFYFLNGNFGGEFNAYYEYKNYIVNNPYLKLEKIFDLEKDCVLIRNDSANIGLLPLLEKYAFLNCDSEITLNLLSNTMRSQFFISASDDATKESAKVFIDNLLNGKIDVIGDNAFLESIKVHSTNTNGNIIQQLTELNQYIKASAYNEIGLNANFNMKRERLNESEVELNTSILIPLIDNMLECRKDAIKKINEKYGLDISVDLSSVWKAQKESVDKVISLNETKNEIEQNENDRPETTEKSEVKENENN